MNILLVEDHRLVADAIQVMLKEINPSTTVSACYSTTNALTTIDSGRKFDLVITDLLMPGIDGIGLLIGLKNRDASIPVVILTGSDDDAEMVAGLQQVVAGGTFFPDRIINPGKKTQVSDQRIEFSSDNTQIKLGKKQLNVLQLMADGNSNKQISQIVGITEATVKYHSSQLFKLLGVKNRTSCVREAQRRGLINTFEEPAG